MSSALESFARFHTAIRGANNEDVLPDAEVVLDRQELRNVTLDDRQLMREILWALIDDAARHIAMLEAAVKDNDPTRATRVARYAARACVNVGANAAGHAFRAVERQAASGDLDRTRSHLPIVREAIEHLRAEAAGIS